MANILIVDNSTGVTGANRSIALFAKALNDKHRFFWAVSSTIPEDELRSVIGPDTVERFDFIEISRRFSPLLKYIPRLFSNTRKLARSVRTHNIDVVHMNDAYNMCGVLL